MTTVTLNKLQATGNDFLVAVLPLDGAPIGPGAAAALCDRHRGIGADGLISVLPTDRRGVVRMRLRNADGSEAELSGNGMRCLAWAADRAGLVDGDELTVETVAGDKYVSLRRDAGGEVVGASVDMGPATFVPEEIPLDAPSPFGLSVEFHGVHYEGDAVGMGNPHLVLFVADPGAARVTTHGPRIERDERFPARTNVEFVAPDGSSTLEMRVWERGVGETLSCGSGACAAAAVAHRRGLVGSRVRVRVLGGDLVVDVGETIVLGGPVVHVFDVELDPGLIAREVA